MGGDRADDDPPDLAALARLHILNTLILARSMHRRSVGLSVIRYETSVLDPAAACTELARLVPEVTWLGTAEPARTQRPRTRSPPHRQDEADRR